MVIHPRGVYLDYLGTEVVAGEVDCKLLDLCQLITTGLGVLEETSHISVTIFVESFAAVFVLSKHFDVDGLERFGRLLRSYLELTKLLICSYLQVTRVIGPKMLLIFA